MKNSQKRTCCDISLIHQDEFHDFCRNGNPSSFIRNRKMPLKDLLFTMINRRGITLTLELRNYMKTVHPGMEISKLGCLKQRMKLNPLAFYEIYRHHNRNFYAEPGFSTFHGYLVLARLKSSDYKKEQFALSAPDTWVDINLDKSRTRHYKGTDIGRQMEELGAYYSTDG